VAIPFTNLFTTGKVLIVAVFAIVVAYGYGRHDGRRLAETRYADNVAAATAAVRKEEKKISAAFEKQNRQLQADYNKLQMAIAVKGSKLDEVFADGSTATDRGCVLSDDQLRALEDAAAGSQRSAN